MKCKTGCSYATWVSLQTCRSNCEWWLWMHKLCHMPQNRFPQTAMALLNFKSVVSLLLSLLYSHTRYTMCLRSFKWYITNLQMSSFLGPPPSGWTLDIVGVIFGRDFLRRWCRSFCSCFCFWTFNCGCGWWQRQRGGSGEGGRRKSRRRKGHALTNCSRFLPFLVAICFSYLHGKFRCCLKWIAFSTRHHFFCQLWDSMLRRSIVVIIVDHSYAWMVQCELWVGGWMIF